MPNFTISVNLLRKLDASKELWTWQEAHLRDKPLGIAGVGYLATSASGPAYEGLSW